MRAAAKARQPNRKRTGHDDDEMDPERGGRSSGSSFLSGAKAACVITS